MARNMLQKTFCIFTLLALVGISLMYLSSLRGTFSVELFQQYKVYSLASNSSDTLVTDIISQDTTVSVATGFTTSLLTPRTSTDTTPSSTKSLVINLIDTPQAAKVDCLNFSGGKGSSGKKNVPKGGNLCQVFNGRTRSSDCNYFHPNIVNFVQFKSTNASFENKIGFKEYLSMVSVHKFYKPDKMVIHANNDTFTGFYWEKVSKLSTPIEVRKTPRITSIGTKKQKPGYITHEADYLKVSTALKEGGIYMDFDAVILNGTLLREMQRKSECILGRDDEGCTRICAGFFSSVPGSPFVRKWFESYENDYIPRSWLHNAGDAPTKLLQGCPSCYDVLVDWHMSNWQDSIQQRWMKQGKIDWKVKAVAHYMNAGFMKPFKEPKELLKMDTPFTDMVKYVLGDMINEFL